MSTGTRRKRIQRIAASSLGSFIEECETAEDQRDTWRRNFSGGFGLDNDLYVGVPLGTHRDARAMEKSNWSVIEPAMELADSFGAVSEHPGVLVHREGSALCGWVETIYVRRDDAVALRTAMEFVHSLADYPVLDDEKCNEMEWEENHPSNTECYSDDPECPCAINTHECTEWFRACIEDAEPPDDAYLMSIDSEDGTWYCAGPGCGEWRDMERVHANILNRRVNNPLGMA